MTCAHWQQGLREGPSVEAPPRQSEPASPSRPLPALRGGSRPSWGQGPTGQVAQVATSFGREQVFHAGQCWGRSARASADGCQLQRVH